MTARSLRYGRLAYALFVALGLLYFPAKVGFQLEPRACQLALDAELAIVSVRNVAHVVLFGLFFVLTNLQFRAAKRATWPAMAQSALAALVMGAVVELAQGVTGHGNCRLRDLIPDAIGISLAALLMTLSRHVLSRATTRLARP